MAKSSQCVTFYALCHLLRCSYTSLIMLILIALTLPCCHSTFPQHTDLTSTLSHLLSFSISTETFLSFMTWKVWHDMSTFHIFFFSPFKWLSPSHYAQIQWYLTIQVYSVPDLPSSTKCLYTVHKFSSQKLIKKVSFDPFQSLNFKLMTLFFIQNIKRTMLSYLIQNTKLIVG